MKHYGLFSSITAQAGKRDDLAAILIEAAELLQRNKDCLHYLVGTNDDEHTVWIVEAWTDKKAHDASLEPEDVRALISRARPLIASMSEGTEYTIIGGKGL